MGSSRSGSSYRNDDDCYVADNIVEKLQGERNSVIRLMNDAEEKQFKDPSVKEWLVRIKHALYDANALLDEIDTEARFREKYKEDGSPSYSISGFVQGATSKVNRIIEELENKVKQAAAMGLEARDEGAAASAWKTQVRNDRVTSSVLSKSIIVYGREEQKARILKQVLYSRERAAPGIKPEVIAIVGMGGLGKTTLAQYVYNHADVKRRFKRSWACVSDNFDLSRLTQAILESLTGTAAGVRDLAPLQQKLEEQLTGTRFLVVLDDAWDSSKQNWEKLMAPFSTGATGSKIILTTRDKRVAGVVPADHSFQLEPMSEDEAWSLFSCEVFRDGELSQHPKLEAIGKEIVKKCGGSPLAIKTLSGLLRSERKDVEWERVRESSLWQLPEGQKDIIPALGLSYSYLPSHLKTCFAYCSLFPKDYRFSKEKLVNLWVDEGFLQQPNDNRSIEDVGVASFEDLSSRSFFTYYHSMVYDNLYVMHDLIHDLAQMVFADFHLQLNGRKAVKKCKKVRHVYFHHIECSSSSILEDLNQAESLQTFMAPQYGRFRLDKILADVLLQQLSLRVLCLQAANIKTLPDTISNLKQLRHLDVSYTYVEELPASLCKLYNLRSLLCMSCHKIKEFHYNTSTLRHFTLSGLELHVNVNIDGSTFRFDTDNRVTFIASDLLECLRPHRDVKEVCIRNFNGTKFPGWLVDPSYRDIEKVELYDCRISSGLMPALGGLPSLKHLQLGSVRNVKKLGSELYNSTVPFGSLLEKLYFADMEEWEEWEPSDDAAAGGICFFPRLQKLTLDNCPKLKGRLPSNLPSLEELYFAYMYEWEEWEPSDAAAGGGLCFFPRLQKLTLYQCPKLKGRLPSNLPSLKELHIDRCRSLVELNGCHLHGQVVVLKISFCGRRLTNSCLDDMRDGMFPHLQRLEIGDSDYFESFPAEDSLPTSLTYLVIRKFTRLKKLDVFWLRSLTNLEELVIDDCRLLESLGYCSDVDDCSSDDEFPFNSSLRRLCVRDCENLKTINGAWLRSLISLRELWIDGCVKLEALPEEGLPRSLTVLRLAGFKNINRQHWIVIQNLTSLEKLYIASCSEFLGLAEVGLPRSLVELHLRDIKIIRREDWIAIQNLTSLEELHIYNCRELKALTVKLPCSLKKLELFGNHRDIRERCKRDTGPDWPNIAHVPHIIM